MEESGVILNMQSIKSINAYNRDSHVKIRARSGTQARGMRITA
jgi:hypothetical protein